MLTATYTFEIVKRNTNWTHHTTWSYAIERNLDAVRKLLFIGCCFIFGGSVIIIRKYKLVLIFSNKNHMLSKQQIMLKGCLHCDVIASSSHWKRHPLSRSQPANQRARRRALLGGNLQAKTGQCRPVTHIVKTSFVTDRIFSTHKDITARITASKQHQSTDK